jgi:hypothetical protein
VSVVEGEPNTVQSKTFEELGIFLLEEVLQELGLPIRRRNNVVDKDQLTLSKKNSDLLGPTTSARAVRIWNSQPGYPEMKFSMLSNGKIKIRECIQKA